MTTDLERCPYCGEMVELPCDEPLSDYCYDYYERRANRMASWDTALKVITDKDGKMRTVDDMGPTPEQMERLRRETRDVIQGNVPFHKDPFTPEPEPVAPDPVDQTEYYGYGYFEAMD